MNVIFIGSDRKLFEEDSEVRKRMIWYSEIFEKISIIVFADKNLGLNVAKIGDKITLYPTNSVNKFWYMFDAWKLGKKLDLKNTVVSVQDPFESSLAGLALKFYCRVPLQIQIHTDFENKYFIFHSFLNFIRLPIAFIALSFADSVRCVSRRIANKIHAIAHNISVLPVYTESKITNLAEHKINTGLISILTVARFEKEKNIETALYAFKTASEKFNNLQFIIVGDGSEMDNLKKISNDLGLEQRVKFVGWQNDLEKYYMEADIYISSSFYEGYGMSVIEAASAGLPLILSDTGIAGEIFHNNEEALIVEAKSAPEFSKALETLATDSNLRKTMGEKARKAAKANLLSKDEYLARYKKSIEEASSFFNNGWSIFKKNILLRYLISGLTGAATNLGLLYVFTSILGIWYLYSSILSFLTALFVSFFLQKFWTFNDKNMDNARQQFYKFLGVALIGILVNSLFMFILVDYAHIWYISSQIITAAIVAIINFLIYKFLIFHKLKNK